MRITLGNKIALGFALVLVPMIVALLIGLTGFHTDVDTYAEVLAEGEALISRVAGTMDEYESLVQQIASVSSAGEGEFDPLAIAGAREEFLQAVQAMSDYQSRQMQELQKVQDSQAAAAAANFSLRTIMVTTAGISVLLGIIASIALSYSIGRSVRRTAEAASRLAEGDLTVGELPVFSSDEIGELQGALNRVFVKLQEYVEKVQGSVASVLSEGQKLLTDTDAATSAAAEIAAALHEVSEGTNQQLNTVDEIQNFVERIRQAKEQIDQSMQEQAQDAEHTRTAVQHAAEQAERFAAAAQELAAAAERNEARARSGSEALDGIAEKTAEVHEVGLRLATCLDELTAQSQTMNEVMQLSRKLADKAQLVSLAAMGAANTGDDRSNIAIIVAEVQQIARHTAEARELIEQHMTAVQSAMMATAEAVQETIPRIEAAVQSVSNARSELDEVLRTAGETKQKILEISASAQELVQLNQASQSAAEKMTGSSHVSPVLEELTALSDQLEQAIAAITSVSQATAATTEGAAASALQIQTVGTQMHEAIVSLNAMAETLAGLTQQFQWQVEEPPLDAADVGAAGVGPAAEELVVEGTVAEEPADEASVVEESVAEKSTDEETVVEEAMTEETAEERQKVQIE